jgi:hypothetical protein
MHLVASKFMKHDMNNNIVLATHFFLIGVIVRLLSEYSGIKYNHIFYRKCDD